MKHLIAMLILATGLTAFAEPGPNQDQDQQQQGQDQEHQHPCPGGCYPHPMPPVYVCHVQMTDSCNRPLYTYWGRMPTYQSACGVALNLCMRDASMGYGGYGARCYILGK
ncbi:MAG: hypothetical protein ACJ76H_11280 [Bacteriovoracaceae bacterium]